MSGDTETWQAFRAGRLASQKLAQLGFDVVTERDIEAAHGRLIQLGKPSFTPAFDPRVNDLSETNSFGMFLQISGNDVAGVCARLDDTGREPVGKYWPRLLSRHYPLEQVQRTEQVADPVANSMHGKLAYLGELFFAEQKRGSISTLSHLIQCLHVNAFLKWQYDFVYAFVRERDARRGAVFHYHFNRQVRGVQKWNEPPKGRSSSETLLYSTRDEVCYNFSNFSTQSVLNNSTANDYFERQLLAK